VEAAGTLLFTSIPKAEPAPALLRLSSALDRLMIAPAPPLTPPKVS
jgi:hypothetical protein